MTQEVSADEERVFNRPMWKKSGNRTMPTLDIVDNEEDVELLEQRQIYAKSRIQDFYRMIAGTRHELSKVMRLKFNKIKSI